MSLFIWQNMKNVHQWCQYWRTLLASEGPSEPYFVTRNGGAPGPGQHTGGASRYLSLSLCLTSLGTKCGCWGSNNKKRLNHYPSMSQIRTFNPGQLSLLFYSIFQIFISKLDHNTTILHQAWSKYSKVSKKWASGRAWWWSHVGRAERERESSAALQSVLQSPWFLWRQTSEEVRIAGQPRLGRLPWHDAGILALFVSTKLISRWSVHGK